MKKITRREATKTLLITVAGTALGAGAAACGSEGNTPNASSSSSGGSTSSGGSSSGGSSSGASSGGSSGGSSGSAAAAWATGGTAAMTAKPTYPDPFASAGGACTLYVSATEGPCTEAAEREREDVSEGEMGLPMRLALRFVDASCKPVANAKVKIWHTELSGSYTGNTPNDGMCVTVPAAGAKHAFRGTQTTNANGVVYFDSCFPGWYGGRAIHIHFTVTANGKSFTSQLIFDDTLVDEIFTTHPDYVTKGLPDTHNANDGVVPAASVSAYTMTTARMSDGAMLASKQISMSLS